MQEKFPSINKEPIDTLQINIGYKCNQACKHCHVNSSPLRTEKMSNEIISLIPKIVDKYKIKTLDIGDLYWHDVDYPNDLDNAKLNINKIASKKTSTKLKIV